MDKPTVTLDEEDFPLMERLQGLCALESNGARNILGAEFVLRPTKTIDLRQRTIKGLNQDYRGVMMLQLDKTFSQRVLGAIFDEAGIRWTSVLREGAATEIQLKRFKQLPRKYIEGEGISSKARYLVDVEVHQDELLDFFGSAIQTAFALHKISSGKDDPFRLELEWYNDEFQEKEV